MNFNYASLASCGKDVYISPKCTIKQPHLVHIGNHVAIDECIITCGARIGNYVHISPYTTVIGGKKGLLIIGNFVTISSGCRIICGSDEFLGAGLVGSLIPPEFRDNVIFSPVTMENYSSIATNVILSVGVTINEGAVVGANSFVNKDIPAWTICVGSPAKFLKHRERNQMQRYGEHLLDDEV